MIKTLLIATLFGCLLLFSCNEEKQYSIEGYWKIQKFEVIDPSKLNESEKLEIEHSRDLLESMEIEFLNNRTFNNHLGEGFVIPGTYDYKTAEKTLIMNPGQLNEEKYIVKALDGSALKLEKADQPLLLIFEKVKDKSSGN